MIMSYQFFDDFKIFVLRVTLGGQDLLVQLDLQEKVFKDQRYVLPLLTQVIQALTKFVIIRVESHFYFPTRVKKYDVFNWC